MLTLISRCLKKARDQHATVFLITPHWTAQPWFPMARTMSIDYPKYLPHLDNLLEATANADPPSLPIQPNLVAWLISGDPSWTKEFQKKLRTYSPLSGEKAPIRIMTLHGESGNSGASATMYLPFLPLVTGLNY